MDETAESVASGDPPGGAMPWLHRTVGRSELQCSVRSLPVVVPHVLEHALEVSSPEDEHVIQALLAQGSHPALGVGVAIGRPDRAADKATLGPMPAGPLRPADRRFRRPGLTVLQVGIILLKRWDLAPSRRGGA